MAMYYNDGSWTPRNQSPVLYGASMMDILMRQLVAKGHTVTLVVTPPSKTQAK